MRVMSRATICVNPNSLDHSILHPIYAQMVEDDQVRFANALRSELGY